MKNLSKFFRDRVFKDFHFKLLHIVLILGICYGFTSIPSIVAQANNLGLVIPPQFRGFFGTSYTSFQAYTIFGFGMFLILLSTLSYVIKSWRFDFFTQYLPLVVLNILLWVIVVDTTMIPFSAINTLFVVNLAWNGTLRLARSEKDHKLVTSVFGRYIDKDVADSVISKGENFELDGQLKEMTVMFSDIRGFTTLSESLDPKRLIAILNYYLTEMIDIVLENRGTIDKFIGDAVMAFWNAPTKDKEHSQNAVKTALQMQRKMHEIQVQVAELGQTQIGIGIARGPMVVGNVGGKNRFDYTVLGDTVNLASRLESLTKKYGVGILMNQSACEVLKGVIFRQIDVITVKGKSKAVTIYEPMIHNTPNQAVKEQYEYAFSLMQSTNPGTSNKAFELFNTLASNGDNPSQVMLERLKAVTVNAQVPKVWQWETK